MKYFKYPLIAALLITITYGYFLPSLYELKVNINKYTQRNINQNTGLHRFVLKVIKKATFFLPHYQYAPLNREKAQIGTGTYKNYDDSLVSTHLTVQSSEEIIKAITTSSADTSIHILPGIYKFSGNYIEFKAKGREYAPIILKADKIGEVVFEMDTYEGFVISSPYIIIENIIFRGTKHKIDSQEHAIHLTKNADNVDIRHNEFINFNAHIKSNGIFTKDGIGYFPDNVVIQHNNFYNEWKRNTASPASPIDVVGGKNWVIKNNFIADFGKYGRRGEGITYGLFLKGASENGLIENNLIACEWNVAHTSANDVRIGISLGNGGTGIKYCMDKTCNFEHKGGLIKNNTILNCKNDVGIYINKGLETRIQSNYIANSLGIDVRYPASTAKIYDNYIDGRIEARHGATIETFNNTPTKELTTND